MNPEDFGHWSEELCFEPLQIAIATNCDKWENFTVAICDFVEIYDECPDIVNWVQ